MVEGDSTKEVAKNTLVHAKRKAFMQLGTDGHATDDLLEQYEMGRLDTPELIDFEEHAGWGRLR